MAELAASAVALGGTALELIQKVRGFTQRASVSSQSANELLSKLEQAKQLSNCIKSAAKSYGGYRPVVPGSRAEAESCLLNVGIALEKFQHYLEKLNSQLGDLGSTSNLTRLGSALLQWKLDERSGDIEKIMQELQHQETNLSLIFNCMQIFLQNETRQQLAELSLTRRNSTASEYPEHNSRDPLPDVSTSPLPPSTSSLSRSFSIASTLCDDMPAPPRQGPGATSEPAQSSSSTVSPLITAILAKDASNAKAELSRGAEIMARSTGGWTALHHAAHCSKSMLHTILKSKQPKDINAEDNSGQTPLHIAASIGREDIGALLLHFGADINAIDRCSIGRTPLWIALSHNREKFVEMLLERGAPADRNRLPKDLMKKLKGIEAVLAYAKKRASRP